MAIITVNEMREYVSDYEPNNYLIDGEEFTDTYITLCISLAIDAFNTITPMSRYSESTFPSKGICLLGTAWQMYAGKALLLARNTMNYSDGGIQIPIEERSQLYSSIADNFRAQFMDAGQKLKIQLNMESGWGQVNSDESMFPTW